MGFLHSQRPAAHQITMSTSIQELRANREKHIKAARDLIDNNRGPVTADEESKINHHMSEAGRYTNLIEARVQELQASADRLQGGQHADEPLYGQKAIKDYYAKRNFDAQPDESIRLDDFVRGVAGMKTTTAVSNALSVGTDTTGGYAVPSLVMPEILQALVPASSLLTAGAGIIPLDAGAKSYTTAAVDSVPTAAWRLENGAVAESDPTFRGVVAAPKSLAFFFKISRELLADATNMSNALTIAISQAFAKEMDRAGLRGSGTNPEPRGILNTAGINSVTNGANGASLATTKFANLLTATQNLLQANAPMPTAAIMSPRSLVGLGGLVDTTGQPMNRPELLQPMNMIATSQVPNNLTVGTSNDCSEIYVGDFSTVAFMVREQLSIQLANELFAATGQIGFICHARVDVAVMRPSAISVVTGVRP